VHLVPRILVNAVLLAAGGVCLAPAATVADAPASDPVRVFVDCGWYCDMDFIRTEIPWVDYMRDRADAQVHILVTTEQTGGGGRRYTLEFIGLREFAGRADTLVYTASAEATQDIVRRGLANTIKMGLVRYVAGTPLAARLDVVLAEPPRAPGRGGCGGGSGGTGGRPVELLDVPHRGERPRQRRVAAAVLQRLGLALGEPDDGRVEGVAQHERQLQRAELRAA
jgi:hypothetical protein